VGLILAVTCTACRAPSGDEISQAAQPASVAGARLFETAKAKDSITDVRTSMEEVPAAAQPTAQATSHLSYCDRGFRTTGNPRADLARPRALCGPSNGLTRRWSTSERLEGAESDDIDETDLVWPRSLGPAGCGRFVMAFEAQTERPLSVRVEGQSGHLAECRLSQSGFCPVNALVCDPERLRLRSATQGHGTADDNTSNRSEER